jgi:hypothetical protein
LLSPLFYREYSNSIQGQPAKMGLPLRLLGISVLLLTPRYTKYLMAGRAIEMEDKHYCRKINTKK